MFFTAVTILMIHLIVACYAQENAAEFMTTTTMPDAMSSGFGMLGQMMSEIMGGTMRREMSCSEEIKAAVNACAPIIQPLMEHTSAFTDAAVLAMNLIDQVNDKEAPQIDISKLSSATNSAILKEHCKLYQPWKQCIAEAMSKARNGCSPTQYRTTDATVRAMCTNEYFALVDAAEAEGRCLNETLENPMVSACLQRQMNSTNIFTLMTDAGVGGAICTVLVSATQCMRKPFSRACGNNVLDVFDTFISNNMWAIFGKACPGASECAKKRREATVARRIFQYECQEDGRYAAMQCNSRTHQCYCVDENTAQPTIEDTGSRESGLECLVDTLQAYNLKTVATLGHAVQLAINETAKRNEARCTTAQLNAVNACQPLLGPLLDYIRRDDMAGFFPFSLHKEYLLTYLNVDPLLTTEDDPPLSFNYLCKFHAPWKQCVDNALGQNLNQCKPMRYQVTDGIARSVCSVPVEQLHMLGLSTFCKFDEAMLERCNVKTYFGSTYFTNEMVKEMQQKGVGPAICRFLKHLNACAVYHGCDSAYLTTLRTFIDDLHWAQFGSYCF